MAFGLKSLPTHALSDSKDMSKEAEFQFSQSVCIIAWAHDKDIINTDI